MVIWFGELSFEHFIHWRHTKNELKHSFNLFLRQSILSLKSSTQAVAWPVSRGHSCQLYGSFFTVCIFCWDRASCLASSSAYTLRIPVFKAHCHVQLTFYWKESTYRYPTGKSYMIQSLRFQSARFWVPFWNHAGRKAVCCYYYFSVFVKISAVSINYHTSCIDIN